LAEQDGYPYGCCVKAGAAGVACVRRGQRLPHVRSQAALTDPPPGTAVPSSQAGGTVGTTSTGKGETPHGSER